jgi:hypothetical protein
MRKVVERSSAQPVVPIALPSARLNRRTGHSARDDRAEQRAQVAPVGGSPALSFSPDVSQFVQIAQDELTPVRWKGQRQ